MHRLQPGQHSFANRGAGPGGVPHRPGAAAGAAGVGERAADDIPPVGVFAAVGPVI